jgi:hypothetical protein
MAVFARPAVWSYDLPLFRQATADEDELEALLAAIARPDEAIWVIESDELPVAFAWGHREGSRLRLLRLYRVPQASSPEIIATLMARIDQDASPAMELVVAEPCIAHELSATLQELGFDRRDGLWTRPLRPVGLTSLT